MTLEIVYENSHEQEDRAGAQEKCDDTSQNGVRGLDLRN